MRDRDHGLLARRITRGAPHPLSTDRDVAGHGCYAGGCALGDALDGFCDFAVWRGVGLLFFDVEVFGVLADDDEVDWVREGRGGCDGFDGADVGVEVEAFAEGDDGAAIAFGGCCG